MTRRDGYKANRKSIAQKRLEYRKKIWRESDPPYFWSKELKSDPRLLREVAARVDALNRGELKVDQILLDESKSLGPGTLRDVERDSGAGGPAGDAVDES
jgi:hypothetical protein